MKSIFLLNELAVHYASLKEMMPILAVGCIGGTGLILLSQQWSKLVNNRLAFKYQPLFKDLLHKHIYSNQNLYNTNIQNINLPLGEFREHNLSRRSIRQVLVNTILDCRRQFPGEKKKLLRKLYKDLDLELYAILDLDTLKGKSLVSAIEELMVMDIVVDESIMTRFLTHKEIAVQKVTEKYLQRIQATVKGNKGDVYSNSVDNKEEEVDCN